MSYHSWWRTVIYFITYTVGYVKLAFALSKLATSNMAVIFTTDAFNLFQSFLTLQISPHIIDGATNNNSSRSRMRTSIILRIPKESCQSINSYEPYDAFSVPIEKKINFVDQKELLIDASAANTNLEYNTCGLVTTTIPDFEKIFKETIFLY